MLERGVTEGRRAFGNIMKFIMMAMSSNFGNMFSMAGATLILPFLPMLPVQILLNNLLYAVSEMPIPLDEVDSEITGEARALGHAIHPQLHADAGAGKFDIRLSDLRSVAVGISRERSVVPDWLVHRVACHAGVGHLRAAHAAQSAAQPPACPPRHHVRCRSRVALLLPFTPLGAWFGFVPPSAAFLFAIAGLTVSYLLLAQGAKWAFYRLWPPVGLGVPAPLLRAQLPLIGRP